MRKRTVLACVLALSGVAVAPAFAGCDADVKAAEEAIAKVTDAKQKTEAQKHITMAKSELAAANEQACAEHVAAAKAAINAQPYAKP